MAQNNHIRERLDEILAKAPEESQWWNSRRAAIQGDFMKELDEEKIRSREGSIAGTTTSMINTPAASVAGSVMGDDAVMVESPSGKKKRKGKK